jgi:hypothetical protein
MASLDKVVESAERCSEAVQRGIALQGAITYDYTFREDFDVYIASLQETKEKNDYALTQIEFMINLINNCKQNIDRWDDVLK